MVLIKKYLPVLVLFLFLLIVLLCVLLYKYYKTEFYTNHNKKKAPYVKILWMYWEQGIENILDYKQGKYNKMCFDGWKKLNPDWDIRILNKKTALKYVPELEKFNHLTIQSRSDLLRIKLLEKYGGVWADASTLPMKHLTGWIEECDKGTGIFFYRYFPNFPKSKAEEEKDGYISNWFIVAKQPHHYLIKKLADTFEKRILDKSKKYPYFYFHETLTYLMHRDSRIKNYINKLTVSQNLSHSKGSKHPPINKTTILQQPLCYKRETSIDPIEYYDYLNTF